MNGDVTQKNKLVLVSGAVVIAVAGYVWVSGSNLEEVADSAVGAAETAVETTTEAVSEGATAVT